MTVGVPLTVIVAAPLTTVPADPVVMTNATPWALEQAPATTVGGVTAAGVIVAEAVRETLVAAGVAVHARVPVFTQTLTGRPGTATGPAVPDTVLGATAGAAAGAGGDAVAACGAWTA